MVVVQGQESGCVPDGLAELADGLDESDEDRRGTQDKF